MSDDVRQPPKLSDEGARELARNLAGIERGMEDVRAGRGQPTARERPRA